MLVTLLVSNCSDSKRDNKVKLPRVRSMLVTLVVDSGCKFETIGEDLFSNHTLVIGG